MDLFIILIVVTVSRGIHISSKHQFVLINYMQLAVYQLNLIKAVLKKTPKYKTMPNQTQRNKKSMEKNQF